jgi:ATP-dependent protease ClpP protease subunit
VKVRNWYRFRNQSDPAVAEIQLMGIIGDWIDEYYGFGDVVTAKQFVQDLAALPETVKTIRVLINSPGGDVFAGITIANALRMQSQEKGRTVETYVEGLAASAASIVLMGGDRVVVADNALVMIHNPWTYAMGTSSEMRKAADQLDAIRDALVATYQWHSPLSADEIVALMDAETWMDAQEALAQGFATEVAEGMRAAASLDTRAVAKLKVPDRFAARVAELTTPRADDAEPVPTPADPAEEPPTPEPTPAPDPDPAPAGGPQASVTADAVMEMCAAAGLDLPFTRALIAEGLTPAAAAARVSAEKGRRMAEDARVSGIKGLCSRFKAVSSLEAVLLGDGTTGSGVSFDTAKAIAVGMKAAIDVAEIDAGLKPDQLGGGGNVVAIDTRAIYAARNKRTH